MLRGKDRSRFFGVFNLVKEIDYSKVTNFFKPLKNDPGYKFHDFWWSVFNVKKAPPDEQSALKNETRVKFQPGSIFLVTPT